MIATERPAERVGAERMGERRRAEHRLEIDRAGCRGDEIGEEAAPDPDQDDEEGTSAPSGAAARRRRPARHAGAARIVARGAVGIACRLSRSGSRIEAA